MICHVVYKFTMSNRPNNSASDFNFFITKLLQLSFILYQKNNEVYNRIRFRSSFTKTTSCEFQSSMWRSHHYDCIFLIFCEFTISSPTLLVIYDLWRHLFQTSILQFLKLLSLFKKGLVMVSQFALVSSSFSLFYQDKL